MVQISAGENYYSYNNLNFILLNRREGMRQLTRMASAVRKMNAQIFRSVSCRGTEIREEESSSGDCNTRNEKSSLN